jgi:hypothetical protein
MKFNDKKGIYESGSFEDVDENSKLSTGTSLATGGKDRMLATAHLHTMFPKAIVVPMSRTRDISKPTYAEITKVELVRKGVDPKQILLEEISVSTITEFKEAAKMWQEKKYKNIVFVSSNWHLPRAKALFNHLENFAESGEEEQTIGEFVKAIQEKKLIVQFVGSTEILSHKSSKYEKFFVAVEKSEGMLLRNEAEEKGKREIAEGRYANKLIPKKIWPNEL